MDNSRLALRAGCLFADCRHADLPEMAQTCRELAAKCLSSDANRVLVLANGCNPDGNLALRNAFTTMLLAGIPAGFRLALVTDVPRVTALFAYLERDLLVLGVHARSFGHESEAVDWLRKSASRTPTEDERASRRQA
jgi:hypothetical protein